MTSSAEGVAVKYALRSVKNYICVPRKNKLAIQIFCCNLTVSSLRSKCNS